MSGPATVGVCSVCGREGEYALYGAPPRLGLCPGCGTKPRHRALAVLLRTRLAAALGPGRRVLEVGPNAFSLTLLEAGAFAGASYSAVDLAPRSRFERLKPPHSFTRADAARLPFEAGLFDLVICNNTLPFIPEAAAALRELRRVLKPGGAALLDVCANPGPTLTAGEYRRRRGVDEEFLAVNGTSWYFGEDYPDWLARAGFACARVPARSFMAEEAMRLAFVPEGHFHTVAAGSGADLERFLGRAP